MNVDELARGAGASLRSNTESSLDLMDALRETQRTRHRRRRNARLRGIAVATVLVAAAFASAHTLLPFRASQLPSTVVPSPHPSSTVGPPQSTVIPGEPKFSACVDPVGDSVGAPDLTLVALERPAWPFIHFHWDGSSLPATGAATALFWATSADGSQSRKFVVELENRVIVSEYVLDPATGAREILDYRAFTDTTVDGKRQRSVMLSADSLGASFPGASTEPLGISWTWTASITIDEAIVDTCDGVTGSTLE